MYFFLKKKDYGAKYWQVRFDKNNGSFTTNIIIVVRILHH